MIFTIKISLVNRKRVHELFDFARHIGAQFRKVNAKVAELVIATARGRVALRSNVEFGKCHAGAPVDKLTQSAKLIFRQRR